LQPTKQLNQSSERVANDVRKDIRECKNRGKKLWVPYWSLLKDEENRNRVSQQWLDFNLVYD